MARNTIRSAQRPLRAIAVLLGCGLTAAAVAQVSEEQLFTLTVGYQAEGTDNVRREETSTRSDIIHQPWVMIGYAQRFNRFDLSADYRLEGRRYQRSTFSGEEVIEGRSALNVEVVPGSLRWTTDHVRSETLLDRREADRPENRRESDTLGTGLDYVYGAASPTRINASARAELFDSNRGFDDSIRYNGALSVTRRVSPVQNVGLSVTYLKVDFDEALVPDYDRRAILATFEREFRTAGLDLAAGYNEIRRSGFSSSDGLSFSASGFWEPAAAHRFTLAASREFTDRTLSTVRGIPDFGEDRDQGTADGEVFEETRAELGYGFQRGRWVLDLSGFWASEDFDTAERDTRRFGARVTARYRINPALEFDIVVRGDRREFREEGREDDFGAIDARLSWEVGRNTTLTLRAGYEERDSDAGDGDYVERRIVVGLSHRLL